MDNTVEILLLLGLVVAGYLLYCGAKALWLCLVPVLGGLALGYYCLTCMRLVTFRALRASPLGYVTPKVSSQKVTFDFSPGHLHELNVLAGVLAGAFTALLVDLVEVYTQSFEAAFEGHDIPKYLAMVLAWVLPILIGLWIGSGGGTNGMYERIVEASLRRRGLLGLRRMAAIEEVDEVAAAVGLVCEKMGISWETKYREAIERYIRSHPEMVTDFRPANSMVGMIRQLAKNDLNGLRGGNGAYQRTKVEFEETARLLTVVKNKVLADELQKISDVVEGAKQDLLPRRNWEGFTRFMAEVQEGLANLRHNASAPEEASDSGQAGASSDPKGYYARIGVATDASLEEIKAEYKRMAKRIHPDQNPHDRQWAEEKFKKLQEAYAVLSNEQKRKEYDSQIPAR